MQQRLIVVAVIFLAIGVLSILGSSWFSMLSSLAPIFLVFGALFLIGGFLLKG